MAPDLGKPLEESTRLSLLGHCATKRKVNGSISDEVSGVFN